jgi:hypothetical protein
MAKLLVSSVNVIEGDLYQIMGEDEMLVVYDTFIQAICDGDIYYHKHVFKGHGQDDDGFEHPNRNAVAHAENLANLVRDRGSIDTSYWNCVGNISEIEDTMVRLEREWSDTSDHYSN